MQEVFKRIIEELEIERTTANNTFVKYEMNVDLGRVFGLEKAIEIVKQEAEKFGTDTNVGSNGWILVSERLPEKDKYILLSFSNFSVPCVGRYEEDKNGGAFYIGDEDETCVSQDMFVNAWMNLPAQYQPKGE